ncbi:MAG TPA: NAD-dependent epimerase/dehydratase family protein [Candidatus Omnitrophota bacterium]|jgi:dihydroflavonol-4-reductase|nr:NAD-dependent epimerase/dehydratase family protein [Candidatus Omnitrophota bacterium]
MKVLVTGGTGFIGSTLVRHLLAAGYQVRVLVRQRRDSLLLEHLDVEVVNGNVTSLQAVETAVQGCSIVFNLASLYSFYPFWIKNPKAMYRINVDGTVHMLSASLKYGVRKFVHTSTIATINARSDGQPADESAGFRERGASHYARSKFLAEQEVLKYCAKGLPAVILNPAIVIGERDHKPTPTGDVIVKFLNQSYPGYFDTRWSVADADDVAQAHIAAAKQGRIGERYILANPDHPTLKEIFRALEQVSGVRAPRIRIPYWALFCFTYIDEFLSHYAFRKKPLMPTEGIRFCLKTGAYDGSKAVRELGYPATPLRKTLAKAVAWYRKNGYVEPRGIFRIRAHGPRIIPYIMRKFRMDRYTDRLNFGTLFFFAIVRILGLLRKAGAGKGLDGWRRVTESYLRTEQAKFALAVFDLDFWSDAPDHRDRSPAAAKRHCIQRLAKFLRSQPMFHYRLAWRRFCAKAEPKGLLDIVKADFDGSGKLVRLEPLIDPGTGGEGFEEMPADLKTLLLDGIIQAYNATGDKPDKQRPILLAREWKKWFSRKSAAIPVQWKERARDFSGRILSAAFVRFEILPQALAIGASSRFQVPQFLDAKHPGPGILNIVCRMTPDLCSADLWFQFSHVPVDGVPSQEVLNELKKQWGVRSGFVFPDSGYREGMVPDRCSTASGDGGVFHAYQFLDFRPFLRVRNELNKRFGRRAKQVISSAALLIWKLAQYREFEDIKFAIPVDLRAAGDRGRTLGFIFIRPGIYFDKHRPDRGFFAFQQEFNRQLFATRKRRSESYALLEAYTPAPAVLYEATSKFLMRPLQEFVGSLGITIIKKADFFVAPASDVHTDGFIAFSNFSLPAANGGRVGVVSMKGPREKVEKYMNVLHDVMNRAIHHDELYF